MLDLREPFLTLWRGKDVFAEVRRLLLTSDAAHHSGDHSAFRVKLPLPNCGGGGVLH
ncbi:MAG: hypothetical protein LBP75_05040 [Planctomycetota bacterium]|jgi:hypothetical protein|nr:hypothetical protein [Planctomycetota bacterium]